VIRFRSHTTCEPRKGWDPRRASDHRRALPADELKQAAHAARAFCYRFAGEPPFTPTAQTFSDVSPSHPFYDEIEWMAEEGISEGYQPGPTYRPGAAVTRQAMSAFLHRLSELPT
jgi:hypothetical protein